MDKHKGRDIHSHDLDSQSSSPHANLDKEILTTPAVWGKSERRTWVAALFLGTTILFSSRIAMPVCATAMAKEFGWNKERLGTVMGCFFWGYASTQILGGYLADRFGGDRVLCFAALTWGIVTFVTPYVAYIYADSFITLVLLGAFRVILGFSQGLHYPSMTSLLSHNVREGGRSFSMGAVSAGSSFGSLLCGGIGSIILESHGWQGVFYFIGICALLWTMCVWKLSKIQQKRRHVASMTEKVREPVPWKLIFSKTPLWCVLAGHFCNNASYFILLMWLPTFFSERFPNEKAWVFNVVPWLMSIPASVFGGWLSDRIVKSNYGVTFARKFIQSISMLGCGFFAMMLPHCDWYPGALVVAGLSISCQTFHNSAILVNPQDIAPSFSGSVFGIMNTAGAIPGFLGVYFAGFVLNASGSWNTVFTSVFFTNVIGLTIFVIGGTAKKII